MHLIQKVIVYNIYRDEASSRSLYIEGHIPTAINIPADAFASASSVLPKEKKIIVYCNTGSRSHRAYKKLIQFAYPDIYQTLLTDWKEASMPLVK